MPRPKLMLICETTEMDLEVPIYNAEFFSKYMERVRVKARFTKYVRHTKTCLVDTEGTEVCINTQIIDNIGEEGSDS